MPWCCWHATQRHKHSTPAQTCQLRRLQQCAMLPMGQSMLAAVHAAVRAGVQAAVLAAAGGVNGHGARRIPAPAWLTARWDGAAADQRHTSRCTQDLPRCAK